MTPPRGPESRYHGVARVTRQGMRDQPTAAEPDSPLAAMITAVADGQLLTRRDKERMRLLMVDEALNRGLTWTAIAAAFGYPSGKQAKKIINALRTRVKRTERLGSPA